MWLFFSDGFLSIVAHRERPNHLLVRSRNMAHLKVLFPNAEHFSLVNSDYAHRAIVSRKEVSIVLTNYLMTMKYDNYKNSINEYIFKETCNVIWSIMYQYGINYRRE